MQKFTFPYFQPPCERCDEIWAYKWWSNWTERTHSAKLAWGNDDATFVQHTGVELEHVVGVHSHKVLGQVPLKIQTFSAIKQTVGVRLDCIKSTDCKCLMCWSQTSSTGWKTACHNNQDRSALKITVSVLDPSKIVTFRKRVAFHSKSVGVTDHCCHRTSLAVKI